MSEDYPSYHDTMRQHEEQQRRIKELESKIWTKKEIEELVKREEDRINEAVITSEYLLKSLLDAKEVDVTVNLLKDGKKIRPNTKIIVKMKENKVK